MKTKYFLFLAALLTFSLISCDETTDSIGGSLIGRTDNLKVSVDTFDVTSSTILAKKITSRSSYGYLGSMLDSETGSLVTAHYTPQFNVLDSYRLPTTDSIKSRDVNNKIIADSCEIRLFFDTYYGDSLAQIKITVNELAKALEEGTTYYSDFNPEQEGYLRTLNGLKVNRTYTLSDQFESDSIKKLKTYSPNISIKLNEQYTDKNGVTYNNYGTYILQKYLTDSTAFKNSYRFLHEVCPGFFFKVTGGIGSIARIKAARLNIYFKLQTGGAVKTVTTTFNSTEEVLQLTTIEQNNSQLAKMISANDYTYLKTPAGLFTQLELPINEAITGHENDSLNSAKIQLFRINDASTTAYTLDVPQNILMVAADSLSSFFANNKVVDNKTSFLATYSSSTNSYTFNNIAGLVTMFAKTKAASTSNPNWGKVVLVPVEVGTTTDANKQVYITKISHYMGLSSVKLRGKNNSNKIKMSMIYSKFDGR